MVTQSAATASIDAGSTAKPASKRILTLDLLRGYFLLDMILTHLNYWPNGLDWVGARAQLFVSGAEGFFLISGIVLGIVRGRKLIDQPLRVPSRLLLKRSLQLYITYIISILFCTFVGWLVITNPGLKFGIADPSTPIPTLIWKTLTFQYIYGWADYLRLYVIFLLLSPIAIWLMRKHKWWIVLLVSAFFWAIVPRPDYPDNVGVQPFHWGILFFGGLIIGFHWDDLHRFWLKISLKVRKTIIASIVTVTVCAVLFNVFLAFGGNFSDGIYQFVAPIRSWLSTPFDKENLPLPRLLYALFCFISGFWLFNKFEPFVMKYAGWLLLHFGTNSLYVYTVQAFLVFFAGLILPSGSKNLILGIVLTYGTLALIWLMIRYKVLFKVIPR